MNPTVSILLPIYNCEKYINESINSLLAQTYTDFELIIINDGSDDSTMELVKQFSDNRIIIINNKNNFGISDALNKGLKISKGKFIARADGDDYSYPHRLECQLEYFKTKKVDLVCSKHINHNIDTNELVEHIYRPFDPQDTKSHMFFFDITHGTVMFKKSIIKNFTQVYKKRPAEDYDLFVRMAKQYRFYCIPKNLVKVKIRHDSLCGEGSSLINEDIDDIRLNQLHDLNILPSLTEIDIHRCLMNRNYKNLSSFNLICIYNWISKIVTTNNKLCVFPNPHFSNQWYRLATLVLKYRYGKSIIDLFYYKRLVKKLSKKVSLRNLLYLYKYNKRYDFK